MIGMRASRLSRRLLLQNHFGDLICEKVVVCAYVSIDFPNRKYEKQPNNKYQWIKELNDLFKMGSGLRVASYRNCLISKSKMVIN